jgi:hypothetical protein
MEKNMWPVHRLSGASIMNERSGATNGPALSFVCKSALLIRQENSGIYSHPFPQKTRKWMGHPDSIELPNQ